MKNDGIKSSEYLITAMMLLEEAFEDSIPDDKRILEKNDAAHAAHSFIQAANGFIQFGRIGDVQEFALNIVAEYLAKVVIENAK